MQSVIKFLQSRNNITKVVVRFVQTVCGLETVVLRGKSITAANKGFAIAGVPCFADAFVQGGSSALRMNICAEKPAHRKPPKR